MTIPTLCLRVALLTGAFATFGVASAEAAGPAPAGLVVLAEYGGDHGRASRSYGHDEDDYDDDRRSWSGSGHDGGSDD